MEARRGEVSRSWRTEIAASVVGKETMIRRKERMGEKE